MTTALRLLLQKTMTVTSLLKVPSKIIKKIPPAVFPDGELTVSLSCAAALFHMSDQRFAETYIYTKLLRFNRLHQLSMRKLMQIYELLPRTRYSETTRYELA